MQKAKSLKGEITVPGDKSISHRSIMLGAIAKGITEVDGFLPGADCHSTISCFQKMGIAISHQDSHVIIHGKGLHGLSVPNAVLDCGNSGTTTRLLSGLLSGQHFKSTLTGDDSIQKRPMKRVMIPLSLMGAHIESLRKNGCAPLAISPSNLHGISYTSPVASAQVKSSILLAGLYADGETSITEPFLSRNHSELMLSYFGANIKSEGSTCTLKPVEELYGAPVTVPGDISSAAYFLAAGCIVPNSEILVKNVGINPTRSGILTVMKQMNADLTFLNERIVSGEPVADILVRTSHLKAVNISGGLIPTLIDEIPVIAVMAAFADGITEISDAAELKVKESNRIESTADALLSMGVDIQKKDDGMIINGGSPVYGALIDSCLDHRIAMSFTVASLAAEGITTIKQAECVNISYPHFYEDLFSLAQN